MEIFNTLFFRNVFSIRIRFLNLLYFFQYLRYMIDCMLLYNVIININSNQYNINKVLSRCCYLEIARNS